MEFDKAETATILAALRRFQDSFGDPAIAAMDHFGEVAPLTPNQIDSLCYRINFGIGPPCECGRTADGHICGSCGTAQWGD